MASSLPAAPSGFVRMNFSPVHFCEMSYLAASFRRPPDLRWCSMRQLHCKMSVHIMFCRTRCLWPQKSQVNWPAVTPVWACLWLPAWSDMSRWILQGRSFRNGLMDLVFHLTSPRPFLKNGAILQPRTPILKSYYVPQVVSASKQWILSTFL